MNKQIIIAIAIATIVGSGSFYAGMKYTQNSASSRMQQFSGNASGARGARGSGGFASGEIIAKDDKSITVKLQDGGSKIIFFSGSTLIAKSVSGSLNDLEIGKNVSTTGTANSNGSFTAESIQIRSQLR